MTCRMTLETLSLVALLSACSNQAGDASQSQNCASCHDGAAQKLVH